MPKRDTPLARSRSKVADDERRFERAPPAPRREEQIHALQQAAGNQAGRALARDTIARGRPALSVELGR
jgi:hypothetical protein